MNEYQPNGAEDHAVSELLQQHYPQLLQQVVAAINFHHTSLDTLSDEQLRHDLSQHIRQQLAQQQTLAPLQPFENQVRQRVIDDLVGLGPLEPLLRDTSVSEIMVNRFDLIFIEQHGKLQRSSARFVDEIAVRRVLERIVTPLGRRIDESSPMVDARLPSGARVNGVLPPLAVEGACLTIRKFASSVLTAADLVAQGSMSAALARLLALAVTSRQNIIISGGTGSGKTTLLNILASFVPPNERMITIEDAAELQLQHTNLVRLEARPANQEGQGLVSIRQLVVNALRMRPDRIVIGECRAGESLDMLQAMNTGHAGSLTTLHANNPRDALRRLETMVLMAGVDLPLAAIRQQIASAVQLVVQISRLSDGRRVVTAVSELQGSDGEVLQLADLFVYQREQGHQATFNIPQFAQHLTEQERAEILAWQC